jgi:hypothetical protein
MIKFLDCKPYKKKKISLVGCDLIVSEGANELEKVSLCDLNYPLLDCGGWSKKKYTIPAKESKQIFAGNTAQLQGEIAFLAIRVYYKTSETATRVINFEYKGEIYPIYNLMILSGITRPTEAYQGWDMEPYSVASQNSNFSGVLNQLESYNTSFGGMLISNPLDSDVQIEVFTAN